MNNDVYVSFVLVSDFTEQLSLLYDQHAEALQILVSTFRKKNGELRKERYDAICWCCCIFINRSNAYYRPACHSTLFQAWETFLQEIEADSVSASDVASALSRQVTNTKNTYGHMRIFINFFVGVSTIAGENVSQESSK